MGSPEKQTGSIMVSSTDSQTGTKPVAAHPLFTPLVTLWSGALLGIGTLAAHPAAIAATLAPMTVAQLFPAAVLAVVPSHAALAASLAALGGIAGMAAAHLVKRLATAKPDKSAQSVLVMPQAYSLPAAAAQEWSAPQVERSASPEPLLEVAASPPTAAVQRPVLDISAIELAETDSDDAALDLAAFVSERHDAIAAPLAAPPARSREDTERALRHALAALRELRGAA